MKLKRIELSTLIHNHWRRVVRCKEMNGCLQAPVKWTPNISSADYAWTVRLTGVAAGLAIVVYIIAMIIILSLKLHKKLVYRLAMYQILSMIVVLLVWEVYWAVKFKMSTLDRLYALETAVIMFISVQELIATWFVVHLFALALCHTSLNRLEPLYVSSSVLVPLILASVSFALELAGSKLCVGARVFRRIDSIEGIVGCVLVGLNCAGVVVIGLTLCHRVYKGANSSVDHQQKKVLCEILPLLMYPALMTLAPTLYIVQHQFDYVVDFKSRFVIPCVTFGWGMFFAVSVILHLSVVVCIKRRKTSRRRGRNYVNEGEENRTVCESSHLFVRSYTYYSVSDEI